MRSDLTLGARLACWLLGHRWVDHDSLGNPIHPSCTRCAVPYDWDE